MSAEEKARQIEEEEDEYFAQMLAAYQANPNKPDIDEDIEYFSNHPLTCTEITPEMVANNPDLQSLQNLAYEGTPEEITRNFKDHAFEALDKVIKKHTKTKKHDKVECERALHFFNEAFKAGYKEYQVMFNLYMGRAKLNLLMGQFGHCKDDCVEALKLK